MPGPSGVTSAAYRSVPSATSRIGVQGCSAPAGSMSTRLAPTAACPSRKTVAEMVIGSPTTHFAGYRPHSITGAMSVIGMRRWYIGEERRRAGRRVAAVALPPAAARRFEADRVPVVDRLPALALFARDGFAPRSADVAPGSADVAPGSAPGSETGSAAGVAASAAEAAVRLSSVIMTTLSGGRARW